jgi:hypothetical protein
MWPVLFLLRWSIIAASVVDLPEPVAPTISTMPRLCMTMVFSTSGTPSSSQVRMRLLRYRITMPAWPRWWKALMRKRPRSSSPTAKSSSRAASNASIWRSSISEQTASRHSSGV